MRYIAVLALAAFGAGIASSASADHVDDRIFSDRDPDAEFYICHTQDHRNDRFVFNVADRDYCNDEIGGHVIFLGSVEVFKAHLQYSKTVCMQRSRACQALWGKPAGRENGLRINTGRSD